MTEHEQRQGLGWTGYRNPDGSITRAEPATRTHPRYQDYLGDNDGVYRELPPEQRRPQSDRPFVYIMGVDDDWHAILSGPNENRFEGTRDECIAWARAQPADGIRIYQDGDVAGRTTATVTSMTEGPSLPYGWFGIVKEDGGFLYFPQSDYNPFAPVEIRPQPEPDDLPPATPCVYIFHDGEDEWSASYQYREAVDFYAPTKEEVIAWAMSNYPDVKKVIQTDDGDYIPL